jgi:hypothetical protein
MLMLITTAQWSVNAAADSPFIAREVSGKI